MKGLRTITLTVLSWSLIAGQAHAGSPSLVVRPREGPVGTAVEIIGKNCRSDPAQSRTYLSAEVIHSSTVGTLNLGWVNPDSFRVSFRIPTRSDPNQGSDGARIRPGDRIVFQTNPAVCKARPFAVTRGTMPPPTQVTTEPTSAPTPIPSTTRAPATSAPSAAPAPATRNMSPPKSSRPLLLSVALASLLVVGSWALRARWPVHAG